MTGFLKNHLFPVEAFFARSLVVTFAVPREEIAHRLPPCLVPDTFQDRYAFIAVAMVDTRNLRPAGFPAFMGQDFFLIGYRIFVRYRNALGQVRRGLFILKSETDRKRMEYLGNCFTHYNYTTTDITQNCQDNKWRIESRGSGLLVEADTESAAATLPEGSPFANWTEARRFAGPMPFTFSWKPRSRQILIIEGARQHWQPEPATLLHYQLPFLDSLNCPGLVPANAFTLRDVPYRWKKGRFETWHPIDNASRA